MLQTEAFLFINTQSSLSHTIGDNLFCGAKFLVGNFAFANDVGRPRKIQSRDMGAIPLRVHDEPPAGHIDLHALTRDLALKGQDGDHGAGAGAAGIGEVLHAPFKGSLIDGVLAGDLIEVHVGPLGKGGMMPHGTAQLPQLALVRVPQVPVGDHGVGQARVPQLYIGAGIPEAAHLDGVLKLDGGGVVQPDAV
ncbi:hypothetical protein SDC9_132097 [bioreactor metagenome]|uniref:Uncharacterized protein n=1 Tax=bioreactor metagenome TaxID=1076179 RepID=A0A645D674_9ZZZZ